MVSSWRLEALENRQLLSVALPMAAEVQPLNQPALTAMVAQPKLVANSYFLGSPKLGGISGKLALKIKTVSGTAVTATLYSGSWGGFSVAVTGTITSAGVLTLSGKSSTCKVTGFTGTLSSTSKVISGTCTIVQMGWALTGTITASRVSTAPVLTAPAVPSTVGTYAGTGSDAGKISISITKQTGCLFWGKSFENKGSVFTLTGIEYAPNKFTFHIAESGGYTNVSGSVLSDGSWSGSWAWRGTDGSTQGGTFTTHKA